VTKKPNKSEGPKNPKQNLTARKVQKLLKQPGRYRDSGVRGLLLCVASETSANWALRFEFAGKEHMMGLGSAREFTLKSARERALAARQKLADKIDPLAERQAARAAATAEAARAVTFTEACRAYLQQHAPKWQSVKHAAQWRATLRDFAEPILGALPVAAIDVPLVLKVLEQPVKADRKPAGTLWTTRPVTANRLRSRVENVLDWAKARQYREGDNPAAWAVIGKVLPAHKADNHHAALDGKLIPAFMQALRGRGGSAARALEFLIYTASRSQEAIEARWDEIDLAAGIWTVPAARMKMRKEHRVPLAPQVIELLHALPREDDGCVFLGAQAGRSVSHSLVSTTLKELAPDITLHGFRSSFRDWAGERTAFPHDVCEAALAHIKGKTERAYQRGDLFAKRRKLMSAWSEYCSSAPMTGVVVALRGAVT
jgi:integrase